MTLLTIENLKKRYASRSALNGVNMVIESGGITGLLGPNASGKTTLLKTVAGLLSPDSGTIVYPGGAPRGVESKKTISFLPDQMRFPTWMKARDAFAYWQALYPDYDQQRANFMAELMEIPMDNLVLRMSKGMQERLSLALVFSRKTSLYLLDEPLGGIDPLGKSKVLESIVSMQLDSAAILLSTHLVKDVKTIFDNFYFLAEGQIIYHGNCEEERERTGRTVEQIYLEVYRNAPAV